MNNSPRAMLKLQENRRLVAQIAHTRVNPNTGIMPPLSFTPQHPLDCRCRSRSRSMWRFAGHAADFDPTCLPIEVWNEHGYRNGPRECFPICQTTLPLSRRRIFRLMRAIGSDAVQSQACPATFGCDVAHCTVRIAQLTGSSNFPPSCCRLFTRLSDLW